MPDFPHYTDALKDMPHFTTSKVRGVILACKSSYSCPSKFLKLFPKLCTPLATLFNMSIYEQLVSDAWKLAHVISIFKVKGLNY